MVDEKDIIEQNENVEKVRFECDLSRVWMGQMVDHDSEVKNPQEHGEAEIKDQLQKELLLLGITGETPTHCQVSINF